MTSEYRVIVVDDVRDTRRLLSAGIASLGKQYHIDCFPSAEEALLELSRARPHLLVTDVRLTGISGLDLLKRVRSRVKELKVIVITGLNDLDLRRQALESGADAFFTQPVDMDVFLARVRSLVNGDGSGEVDEAPPAAVEDEPPVPQIDELAGYLERFVHTFDAQAAVLLDTSGDICLSVGDGSIFSSGSSLTGALLQAARAAEAVYDLDGRDIRGSMQIFYGDERVLLCSPLPDGHTLVLALHLTDQGVIQPGLVAGVHTLCEELAGRNPSRPDSDGAQAPHAPDVEPEMSSQNLDELSNVEPDPDLEAIFTGGVQLDFLSDDVDRYWDTLVSETDGDFLSREDVISYEEASEMGLAPEGDQDAANIS